MALTWLAVPQLAPEGEWSEGIGRWLHAVGEIGPWILAALVGLLVIKALLRRKRYRVGHVFDEAARERVHEAIRAAEAATVGEIVPVVLERSDPHPVTGWRAGFAALLVGSGLLVEVLPWDHPFLLLLCQCALGLVGWLLARLLPDLARLFVAETRASEVAEEQAFQEFHRHGLHRTEAATGVLIFVSLFERRVVVLADTGIDARVTPDMWTRVDDLILEGVAGDRLADGLVAAMEACGEVLAEHFPWVEGDRNEVPDRLIVRRE